jgi:hypothetical protein
MYSLCYTCERIFHCRPSTVTFKENHHHSTLAELQQSAASGCFICSPVWTEILAGCRDGSQTWHNPEYYKDDGLQHPVSVYTLRNLRSWPGTIDLTISFNEDGYGQYGGYFHEFGLQTLQCKTYKRYPAIPPPTMYCLVVHP